eukprot:603011-Rhodomonas_salina.1
MDAGCCFGEHDGLRPRQRIGVDRDDDDVAAYLGKRRQLSHQHRGPPVPIIAPQIQGSRRWIDA